MCDESARITGTDPGSSPSRAAARTLTDVRHTLGVFPSFLGAGPSWWYSATSSMKPTIFALSSARSSAGIQYSRMVRPPAWWTW
jgi:hypothetical protein